MYSDQNAPRRKAQTQIGAQNILKYFKEYFQNITITTLKYSDQAGPCRKAQTQPDKPKIFQKIFPKIFLRISQVSCTYKLCHSFREAHVNLTPTRISFSECSDPKLNPSPKTCDHTFLMVKLDYRITHLSLIFLWGVNISIHIIKWSL